MQNYLAHKLEDLQSIAADFLSKNKDKRIFAFYGKMGSGKTTFIKALCKQAGVKNRVTSPTFALVNEYVATDGQVFYHFDFYRTESAREIQEIGFDEYLYSGAYCFIEWPEKAETLLPPDTVKVKICEKGKQTRQIKID